MNSLSQHLLWAVVLPFLVAISVVTQARSQGATKDDAQSGFTWTEAYVGSGNTDGFITDLNSTVGYTFGALRHRRGRTVSLP